MTAHRRHPAVAAFPRGSAPGDACGERGHQLHRAAQRRAAGEQILDGVVGQRIDHRRQLVGRDMQLRQGSQRGHACLKLGDECHETSITVPSDIEAIYVRNCGGHPAAPGLCRARGRAATRNETGGPVTGDTAIAEFVEAVYAVLHSDPGVVPGPAER